MTVLNFNIVANQDLFFPVKIPFFLLTWYFFRIYILAVYLNELYTIKP